MLLLMTWRVYFARARPMSRGVRICISKEEGIIKNSARLHERIQREGSLWVVLLGCLGEDMQTNRAKMDNLTRLVCHWHIPLHNAEAYGWSTARHRIFKKRRDGAQIHDYTTRTEVRWITRLWFLLTWLVLLNYDWWGRGRKFRVQHATLSH